jgi:glucose/arabinose dehydrogenase/azurin
MQRKVLLSILPLLCALVLWQPLSLAAEQPWIVFEPTAENAKGKHIVLLAGDEEYRSEEALPMLAKILSRRHGFKCTVVFSVNPDGTINPDKSDSISHPKALDSADLILMALRFRKWPDAEMKHFVDAYQRGVPIVALRTSTHAFQFPGSSGYREFNNFGKRVLGENWVTHWGRHKVEATRGIIEPSAKDHPILRGVKDVFGDSDVYEAYPPADATILMRGQVLKGMKPEDPPASYKKRRASDREEQDVNDPMMPISWTREFKNEAGNVNKIFCTTLGAATDLISEGSRRMVVNAVYWALGMDVPQEADVRAVGEFKPTMYGFGTYIKGVRPSDHAIKSEGASGSPLRLNSGDRIAILGNALSDRLQHSGHFETLIHAYYPEHDLVFRNLSAAGDEVSTWYRSENFGSRDQWLGRVKADVIFAFYGFNESTKGSEGLAKFKADLDKFVKETKSKNFSGKGAPRIVLFSPVANERHQDRNFPDPEANNANLTAYTAAMEEVAAANSVQFVNLFAPSKKLYTEAAQRGQSLTVNGHYLSEEGDRLLAPIKFESVFGRTPPAKDSAALEKLREVVNEKNWQWHQRYRTVDGYNVYGGRSALAYQADKPGFISDRQAPPPHISNYKVMQEEMAQRDVMTENRERRVWAIARGGDLAVDDSNLPPVSSVPSNRPGSNPDGSHVFLSGEEAIAKMTVHSGMEVNLFADEARFPELINPVQIAWDTRGRLWVAAWENYPSRRPTSARGDSLLVFEDTNGDGRADKMTVFADNLNAPTGFQLYKDGVLVVQAPDLWFLRDTDGDGRADWVDRVLMGLDSADSHHTANAVAWDPFGGIYLSDGVFHRTQLETRDGPLRNSDGAVYRFEPRTGKLEMYTYFAWVNPHGRVFDRWGNDLITDATGNHTYYGPAMSGWIDLNRGKHPSIRQFWDRPSRPCAGTGMISSRHFPEEFQGDFLNCNVISFLGIYRVKVTEEGSGLKGETMEHLVHSTDPNFRPADVNVGPDGAIYFADWHNPIIGHMQHHLRDPNRDHRHGRIYRITYKGRPLLKPARIHGAPIPELLELLKSTENQTRELAKVELEKHDSQKVIAAVQSWIKTLDQKHSDYEHHMMEALWVHQWHNIVNAELLHRMLRSPEPRARAAAGRVLCHWRDRVSDSLASFKKLAEDEHPRVRLEAVRAASFYRAPEAADVALTILKRPMDYYLEYVLNETLRQLEPYWRKGINDGVPIAADNPAGIDRLVGSLSTAELQKLPRTPGVLTAILTRPGMTDSDRMVALDALATARNASRVNELLRLLGSTKKGEVATAENLARLFPVMPPAELKSARARILEFAQNGVSAGVRQSAWAALALADDSFDQAWEQASKSPESLADLLSSIPLIMNADFRAKAYAKASPLLSQLPPALQAVSGKSGTSGRYVRIELPRTGTLTLAEVQVISEGQNIARQGKATQSSTAHGGDASRAIDGRTDGAYGSGTQTHTRENEKNPWWELDLGSERPIESITVWNRSEGGGTYAKRLDGFTLAVLDGSRREVFKKEGIPAPAENVSTPVSGGNPIAAVRRAAIRALITMPDEQHAVFMSLGGLITKGEEIVAAAQGIRVLPRPAWCKETAGTAAPALVAWAKKIPAGERTSQDYIETVQVASDLATLLPAEKAAELQRELRDLRVAVFVIRAVREQMRFDTTRIVVEAGKPFEIIVENPDFMPHNLVVMRPGAREKLGPIMEVMLPDQLDSQGRAFVPRSPEILAATKLLEHGQKETLKMTAPKTEGTHEFVCTFPGHWQVMWGQLIVTNDVEGYLQKNPEPPAQATSTAHAHDHFE